MVGIILCYQLINENTETMQAIVLNEPGGPEQLEYTNLPVPVPGADEVLIKVKAISLNPVDVKTRAGKGLYGRFRSFNPLILGWDISGEVTQTGSAVTQFSVGDAVFGMVNFPGHGQAYAAYVTAPAAHLAIKPANISHEEAAGATLAALTAYQALVHHAQVQPGQKLLVHAAAGGVGHYAVQMAKHLGLTVVGTSSAANRDFVLQLGADTHIDYHASAFEALVNDADLVLETIGGEQTFRSLKTLKTGGSLIHIPSGLPEGAEEAATAAGVKAYFFLVQSSGEDMREIARLLEQGVIKSHIAKTYPFQEMAQAHAHVDTGRTVGKVVVTL